MSLKDCLLIKVNVINQQVTWMILNHCNHLIYRSNERKTKLERPILYWKWEVLYWLNQLIWTYHQDERNLTLLMSRSHFCYLPHIDEQDPFFDNISHHVIQSKREPAQDYLVIRTYDYAFILWYTSIYNKINELLALNFGYLRQIKLQRLHCRNEYLWTHLFINSCNSEG